jgi:hypothetical protein
MWLHSEAAPVVDSATQHLLEENNQLLNQISANIETFKVCIYLYAMSMVCTCPFCTLSATRYMVPANYLYLTMVVSHTIILPIKIASLFRS